MPSAAADRAPGIDFARSEHRESWLRHPVFGDPSFDTFARHPGNPVHRGAPPLEWPVNGFLYADPRTRNWYLYVGHYSSGYGLGPGKVMRCTVFRSEDQGRTWTHLGPVFPDEPFCFQGCPGPVEYAPDVSVVLHRDRYHMAYDWVSAGTDWSNLKAGRSGVGHAWSATPEGPFQRSPRPLVVNHGPLEHPVFGKYDRFYASTLVRRRGDWLLLTIVDSGPHFAWGLAARTAVDAEGPYGPPVPLFHVEGDRFQPPLMEYFPSFVHDGWVYAPSTSVALNRGFQMLQGAPLERATDPAAWKMVAHGSLWHGADGEHEASGIWGQTLSGFVDQQGLFHVMFPSKDRQNRGTINLAWRAWDQPYRSRGFCLNGCQGPSLTCLRHAYEDFRLEADFERRGNAAVWWGSRAPLGPDAPRSDASLHPQCRTRQHALELGQDSWALVTLGETGERRCLAGGPRPGSTSGTLVIECPVDGPSRLAWEDRVLWEGPLPLRQGPLGLWVDRDSALVVARFAVEGAPRCGALPLLASEALLGAGQDLAEWDSYSGPEFRYGLGAVHRGPGGRAKWNFHGTGCSWWAPRGPAYGSVELLLDGRQTAQVDLRAETPLPSAPLFETAGLVDDFHALVLQGTTGPVVLDSLEIRCQPRRHRDA